MKILTCFVLAGLLAACNVGATTPSEIPLPSIGGSVATESPSAATTMEESPTALACSEAFANLDVSTIVALGTLDAVSDELDATIAACSAADEWEAAAEATLPGLDISDPQAFIAARCAEVSSLAGAALCAEVGS